MFACGVVKVEYLLDLDWWLLRRSTGLLRRLGRVEVDVGSLPLESLLLDGNRLTLDEDDVRLLDGMSLSEDDIRLLPLESLLLDGNELTLDEDDVDGTSLGEDNGEDGVSLEVFTPFLVGKIVSAHR